MRCYVALGANLGDPVAVVTAAIEALRQLPASKMAKASSLYRTAPVGLLRQPDFINAVVALELSDAVPSASTLLDRLFSIEARFGRERSIRNAPRTLDLDLLLFGDVVSTDLQCTLPHPRMHERAFVLAPLVEIEPALVVPGHGAAAELLVRCAEQTIARLPLVSD